MERNFQSKEDLKKGLCFFLLSHCWVDFLLSNCSNVKRFCWTVSGKLNRVKYRHTFYYLHIIKGNLKCKEKTASVKAKKIPQGSIPSSKDSHVSSNLLFAGISISAKPKSLFQIMFQNKTHRNCQPLLSTKKNTNCTNLGVIFEIL